MLNPHTDADGAQNDVDLRGVIDLHVHADSGGLEARYRAGAELAQQAAAAGMAGLLLKSHYTSTVPLAQASAAAAPGLRVCGGLALNRQAGGLDPARVESVLAAGGRQIWMPTVTSRRQPPAGAGPAEGIGILDEEGTLLPAVQEILRLVARYDAILGTAHLEIAEQRALVAAACAARVGRILVTHPESPLVQVTAAIQQELHGPEVFFERCWLSTRGVAGVMVPMEQIVGEIRLLGIESTVLATDLGQRANPLPVEGMRAFLAALGAAGFTRAELERMSCRNPGYLLG